MAVVVTGLTADRMQEIEANSVVDGDVVAGHLILQQHDGTEIDAGSVVGPEGPQGPPGIQIVAIPGEVKLWPGSALPDPVKYGKWTWANGDAFDIATYPLANAHIDSAWNTAMGQSAPGAGKFRVPDLRGVVPCGLDAMPVGSPRANRVTRSVAIVHAGKTGEELHVVLTTEMPKHRHIFTGTPMGAHGHAGSTFTGNALPGHAHLTQVEWKAAYAANSSSIVITNVAGTSGASAGNVAQAGSNSVSAGTPSGSVSVAGASAGTPAGSLSDTGGDVGHETMQPTVFVPYIVKLDD